MWLKALTEADGDEEKAKVRYVRLRVEQLKKEPRKAAYQEKPNKYTYKLGLIGAGIGGAIFFLAQMLKIEGGLGFGLFAVFSWIPLMFLGFLIGHIIDRNIRKRLE